METPIQNTDADDALNAALKNVLEQAYRKGLNNGVIIGYDAG